MAKEKRTLHRKKQTKDATDETKPTTRLEPLKLKLTVAEPTDTTTTGTKRKRGRTKQITEQTEQDEEFFQTFGHKLTKIEANIKRGTPTESDVVKYEKAKHKAENLANKQQKKERKSSIENKENSKSPEHQTESEVSSIDVPKIKQILFNNYLIDTWYVAPYPEEYSQSSTLYICEFCMKYMKSSFVADRHKAKCKVRYPPGDEIYRDGNVSVFEVDGRKNKIYCQNLCLMAKMFLDHKTLYYDVEPFLFYIMTEADDKGCHFVGYFSKEKRSAMNYNVSCILTMPIFQRKGYGQFLIDFSYLLSKRESKAGSPERPLSDLGLISYRSYWKNVLFHELENQDGSISIDELSNITSLTPDDIISTLQNNNMIHYDKITKHYSLAINPQVIKAHLHTLQQRNYLQLKPDKLKWSPFMLSRDRLAVLLGQTKLTIKDSDESNDVDID
ncbi:acyl-CoA N-acyltransferase [Choanephora cucurbitarum]|nr:acyl-CoA N-acyltransferase [Choanephora cucurbitarum]